MEKLLPGVELQRSKVSRLTENAHTEEIQAMAQPAAEAEAGPAGAERDTPGAAADRLSTFSHRVIMFILSR